MLRSHTPPASWYQAVPATANCRCRLARDQRSQKGTTSCAATVTTGLPRNQPRPMWAVSCTTSVLTVNERGWYPGSSVMVQLRTSHFLTFQPVCQADLSFFQFNRIASGRLFHEEGKASLCSASAHLLRICPGQSRTSLHFHPNPHPHPTHHSSKRT